MSVIYGVQLPGYSTFLRVLQKCGKFSVNKGQFVCETDGQTPFPLEIESSYPLPNFACFRCNYAAKRRVRLWTLWSDHFTPSTEKIRNPQY